MDQEQPEYKGTSTKQGIVVTVLILLGLAMTYLNIKNEDHKFKIYHQAVQKADANNDGSLQYNELSDFLKKLNPDCKMPSAKDCKIHVTEEKTYSDNANIYLGINDLEAYVNNN